MCSNFSARGMLTEATLDAVDGYRLAGLPLTIHLRIAS